MNRQRVMVTGGSGFIGSYVTRALWQEGYEVGVIDIAEPGQEARFMLGDALDDTRFFTTGVDDAAGVLGAARTFAPRSFVHLAAVVDPGALKTDPRLAARVNLGGTINVLEAARQIDAERVVFLSSIAVLPTIQYEPIDGSHPMILATEGPGGGFYGSAKVASEAFCFAYEQGFGLDIRIIRPSAVYGFGMQLPIYVKPMVEGAVRGDDVAFETGGSFPRDYTHAEDVASLAVSVLDAPVAADRVFYGATGRPLVTASEIAEVVRTLIPEASITIGSGLTPNDLANLKYRGVLSIENARTQLGWEPQFSNIHDGIEDYAKRYRQFLNSQTPTH
ncbi:MAG: NAD-dependent epimerase/dehydratase family protein [Acidimicrobiia bacterium]|nr:MAG: NAD-dependent epimerase/dehydratase family protein [Acidimicrobiia bacterium]